jgi:hypothetical protein
MNAMSDISPVTVMRVMPENIEPLWPQFEALFAPALALSGTHKAEDVRRAVMTMAAQLWAQMDGDTVEAAATTEFVSYPVGMFVRVWHAGARKDRRLNDQAFFDLMNRWRIGNRCIGFEAVGRHGWLRRFPTARPAGLIMRWTEDV